jgi:hypothetical protein
MYLIRTLVLCKVLPPLFFVISCTDKGTNKCDLMMLKRIVQELKFFQFLRNPSDKSNLL